MALFKFIKFKLHRILHPQFSLIGKMHDALRVITKILIRIVRWDILQTYVVVGVICFRLKVLVVVASVFFHAS